MNEIINPETKKWAVFHNGNDVFHNVVVEPNAKCYSGQPFMEIFDSLEEAKNKFPNLIWPEDNTIKN